MKDWRAESEQNRHIEPPLCLRREYILPSPICPRSDEAPESMETLRYKPTLADACCTSSCWTAVQISQQKVMQTWEMLYPHYQKTAVHTRTPRPRAAFLHTPAAHYGWPWNIQHWQAAVTSDRLDARRWPAPTCLGDFDEQWLSPRLLNMPM